MANQHFYNAACKESFIESFTDKPSLIDACVSTFNSISKKEAEWGADICTKDRLELTPLLNSMAGIRQGNPSLRISILRAYGNWCLKNRVPGARDGLLLANVSTIDNIRKKMVPGPRSLQSYLDGICKPESSESPEDVYRCYYWLAFCGFPEEEIFEIKCDEVDFKNMTIRHKGWPPAKIYKEAVPALKNCTTLTSFKMDPKKDGSPAKKDRFPGDTLVRGTRRNISVNAMRVETSRRSAAALKEKRVQIQLSYHGIWLSGLFYRTYDAECEGVPADFFVTATEIAKGKNYKDNDPEAAQKRIVRISQSYAIDYENWKSAFSLFNWRVEVNKKKRSELRCFTNELAEMKSSLERLINNEQDTLDNYPENLQNDERFERMQEGLESMEDANEHIANAIKSLRDALS